MPEGQHDQLLAVDTKVDVVMHAIELQSANVRQPCVLHPLPDAGLSPKKVKRSAQVVANGTGCRRTVPAPPSIRAVDLGDCPAGDPQPQGHGCARRSNSSNNSSAEMVSPRSACAMASSNAASSSGERRTLCDGS